MFFFGIDVELRSIPKYGILFFLAHLAASIFPSAPRDPNPPGTRTPLQKEQIVFHTLHCIHNIHTNIHAAILAQLTK